MGLKLGRQPRARERAHAGGNDREEGGSRTTASVHLPLPLREQSAPEDATRKKAKRQGKGGHNDGTEGTRDVLLRLVKVREKGRQGEFEIMSVADLAERKGHDGVGAEKALRGGGASASEVGKETKKQKNKINCPGATNVRITQKRRDWGGQRQKGGGKFLQSKGVPFRERGRPAPDRPCRFPRQKRTIK